MLTIDFETYYDKDFSLSKISTEEYIRSPQFEVIGVCVKTYHQPTRWITGTHEEIKAELLKYDMSHVIAHNAAFDGAILAWIFDIHPEWLYDTLSMSRPIVGSLTGGMVGGSLRALAEYFGIGHKGTEVYNTLGKHRADFTPEELERFGAYCVNDVELTWKLFQILAKGFPPLELYLINLTLKMFTEPKFVLDKPLLEKHLAEVQAHKAQLLAKVGADTRDDFMSNDKFAELLRAQGVEPPTKVSPSTGKETYAFAKTDAEFQALLSHPNETVQALAAARLGLKSTIEETRTERFIGVANRGALPVFLHYYGALNTGRFAGGDGFNLQNLPRGGVLRKAMRAPEGYAVVACDSSQIEARVLAWLSGQTDLVEGFRNGADVYSMFASQVYGRTIDKHNDPEERHVGKTCLAGDTEVLTDHGWKKIVNVTKEDKLWDGEDWVGHNCVVPMGEKETIERCGVRMTGDHKVWIGRMWREWKDVGLWEVVMEAKYWSGKIKTWAEKAFLTAFFLMVVVALGAFTTAVSFSYGALAAGAVLFALIALGFVVYMLFYEKREQEYWQNAFWAREVTERLIADNRRGV